MRLRRDGFTMVEMLVVAGIIAILLAILFPAVQYIRESARHRTCQNHLRNQLLATLGFEAAHGKLPDLYNGVKLTRPRTAADDFHSHSWRTPILPFAELSALHASINFDLPATLESNLPNLQTPVPIFKCPSTANFNSKVPEIYEDNGGKFYGHRLIGPAERSDYEVVGGVVFPTDPPRMNNYDFRGIEFGGWGEPVYDPVAKRPISYRVAQLRDIIDGLSNTIVIGERAGRPDYFALGQPPDPYPPESAATSNDMNGSAWGVSTFIEWLLSLSTLKVNDRNSLGMFSFHPGGANVALAGGEIRFLSEETGQDVLNAMSTRAGRESIPHD